MYDRKLQEKAGKGSAKEESLNLNILDNKCWRCKVWGKLKSYQNSVLYSKF